MVIMCIGCEFKKYMEDKPHTFARAPSMGNDMSDVASINILQLQTQSEKSEGSQRWRTEDFFLIMLCSTREGETEVILIMCNVNRVIGVTGHYAMCLTRASPRVFLFFTL